MVECVIIFVSLGYFILYFVGRCRKEIGSNGFVFSGFLSFLDIK